MSSMINFNSSISVNVLVKDSFKYTFSNSSLHILSYKAFMAFTNDEFSFMDEVEKCVIGTYLSGNT